MLKANQKLALFCEATMGQPNTKMAEGILRYGPNECVAVIDSKATGKSLKDFWKLDTSLPIVGTLRLNKSHHGIHFCFFCHYYLYFISKAIFLSVWLSGSPNFEETS